MQQLLTEKNSKNRICFISFREKECVCVCEAERDLSLGEREGECLSERQPQCCTVEGRLSEVKAGERVCGC